MLDNYTIVYHKFLRCTWFKQIGSKNELDDLWGWVKERWGKTWVDALVETRKSSQDMTKELTQTIDKGLASQTLKDIFSTAIKGDLDKIDDLVCGLKDKLVSCNASSFTKGLNAF